MNNIKNIYQHAGKCYDQQNIKDMIDADMVSTPEGVTYNSPNDPMTSTPVNKPSARKSLRFYFAATKRRFAVFGLASNMLVNKHSDFLALVFLDGVDGVGTLLMLSLTTSGVDSIAASRIFLRFC